MGKNLEADAIFGKVQKCRKWCWKSFPGYNIGWKSDAVVPITTLLEVEVDSSTDSWVPFTRAAN